MATFHRREDGTLYQKYYTESQVRSLMGRAAELSDEQYEDVMDAVKDGRVIPDSELEPDEDEEQDEE